MAPSTVAATLSTKKVRSGHPPRYPLPAGMRGSDPQRACTGIVVHVHGYTFADGHTYDVHLTGPTPAPDEDPFSSAMVVRLKGPNTKRHLELLKPRSIIKFANLVVRPANRAFVCWNHQRDFSTDANTTVEVAGPEDAPPELDPNGILELPAQKFAGCALGHAVATAGILVGQPTVGTKHVYGKEVATFSATLRQGKYSALLQADGPAAVFLTKVWNAQRNRPKPAMQVHPHFVYVLCARAALGPRNQLVLRATVQTSIIINPTMPRALQMAEEGGVMVDKAAVKPFIVDLFAPHHTCAPLVYRTTSQYDLLLEGVVETLQPPIFTSSCSVCFRPMAQGKPCAKCGVTTVAKRHATATATLASHASTASTRVSFKMVSESLATLLGYPSTDDLFNDMGGMLYPDMCDVVDAAVGKCVRIYTWKEAPAPVGPSDSRTYVASHLQVKAQQDATEEVEMADDDDFIALSAL